MPCHSEPNPRPAAPLRRRWYLVALALISLAALLIRYRGVDWPRLHPDEATIGNWIEFRQTHRHLEGRFYAEGFFTLVKPVRALHLRLLAWGDAWGFFQRSDDSIQPPRMDNILYARKVNAWLSVFTGIALFFLVAGATGSKGAGLLAAFWLALSPLHILNSHYAETDIAAILMLTLSLWLWLRVLMKGGLGRFGLAAAVTGYAIGTKFTLTPLLLCALAAPWVAWNGPVPGVKSRILRTLAALALVLAGVVIANPGILDWKWFVVKAGEGLGSVYGERHGLLEDAGDPWSAVRMNWAVWKESVSDLGWVWSLAAAGGLLFAGRKPGRRFWPVTVLFPAAYLAYFVFLAPWTRGQEFLIFYPSLAIWAGLFWVAAAGALHRTLRGGARSALALGLLAAGLLAGTFVQGMRRSSFFAWPDARVQGADWLRVHAPDDRVLGFSPYTDPAFRNRTCPTVGLEQVERTSMNAILAQGVEYIVRNPVSRGRGTCDPMTRQRYPKYDRYWEGFTARAQRLWHWDSLEKPWFRFDAMPLEYWGMIHSPAVARLSLPLFQPSRVDPSSRVAMGCLPVSMGSVKAAEVSESPVRVQAPGPGAPDRAVYVVLQTTERGAAVRVRGMGQSSFVRMPAADVRVLTLRRPAWSPRIEAYDTLKIRADPIRHVEKLSCYVQVLTDPAAVACLLLQKGYPDRALTFLKSLAPGDRTDRDLWIAFSAATAEGDRPWADRLRPGAESLLASVRAAREQAPASVALDGISGIYYDEHSRIRLANLQLALEFTRDGDGPPAPPATARVLLPVRPAAGPCELRFSAALAEGQKKPVTVTFRASRAVREPVLEVGATAAEVAIPLNPEREDDLQLFLSASSPARIELKNLELRWSFAESLAEVERELCRSLARHDLQRLPPREAAAAIRNGLERFPSDPELQRLHLAALTAAGDAASPDAAAAAGAVLERAPDHRQAQAALGRAAEGAPDSELPAEVVFYPYFRLVGLTHNRENGSLRCRFEVLRDAAPTPRVVLLKRRSWKRGWKPQAEVLMSRRPLLHKGEELVAELPLPAGATPPFDRLGLSLRVNTRWIQEDYSIPGRSDVGVPLKEWFAEN